jgi:hypothetical protein
MVKFASLQVIFLNPKQKIFLLRAAVDTQSITTTGYNLINSNIN